MQEINIDIDKNIQSELNTILKKNKEEIPYNKKILVLSGGGTKGLSYIGVFKALDELKILENIHTFSTSSVGALMCSLYLFGYTVKEMEDFIYLFDLKKLTCLDSFNDISPNNLFLNMGLDDGENIHKIINKLLKAKGLKENITLLELYQINKKKFITTTVCLNTRSTEYISYESYPNLRVSDAIRMTSSVPLYYTPVIYNEKYYVDGGCIDNYPICEFKDNIEEVIGIYLDSDYEYCNIKNFKEYFISILQTISDGYVYNAIRGFDKYTIIIKTKISFLQFELSKEEKLSLINLGYEKTIEYFNQN
jgi:NTE family protein